MAAVDESEGFTLRKSASVSEQRLFSFEIMSSANVCFPYFSSVH